MKKEDSPIISLIKAIAFTIKQFKLYSQDHPISRQSLDTLKNEIEAFFLSEPKVTIGSLKGRLIINGAIANDKDVSVRDLVKEFDRLHLEGIVLEKGISITEMTIFLKLMSERSKTLNDSGGFQKSFENMKFKHIRLSTGKFQLVEDGQVVAEEYDIGAGGGGDGDSSGGPAEAGQAPSGRLERVTSIGDIIHRIRSDQMGSEPVLPEDVRNIDCKKVIAQLEKSPQEVAELTVEDTKDPAHLEAVIRRVVRSLVEGLVSYLVEQGKDITKALDRLAHELEKSLKKIGAGEAFEELTRKIPKLFEEESDELRVQMMVKAYQKHGNDSKAMQKMANKIFKQKDVRERLAPSIQHELASQGMPAKDAAGLFDVIDEKESKKKKKVTIDADELEALKLKAEGAEGYVQQQVEKAVEKVEKEKRIILDQKERVDAVVRNLSEGVLVVDKTGKVLMMNPAAEKLLGVKQKEKIGKPVTEDLEEEHMVAMTHGPLDDKGDEISKKVEVVSLNDETQKVLQASTAVIENEDGKTVGMVSVLSDVTKQKEVEDMKGKFVANVSHELRTPLVAIQKSLSLIIGEEVGAVNEEQKNFLSIAHRNIDRLSRLINDLLDVSKLEVGRLNLKPRDVPVCEVISHVYSTLQTWAQDKQVHLKTAFEEENIVVKADSDRITQVLTNLIGNALKFTPQDGSVVVDVKKFQESGREWIEVGVKDTGIGISEEDQKKIFDKFEQVTLAQPAGTPSTGLGLTIAKEIIELHSGSMWVESEPEKGSRFAFKIPVEFCQREEIKEPPAH